jgi:hypothetical protein
MAQATAAAQRSTSAVAGTSTQPGVPFDDARRARTSGDGAASFPRPGIVTAVVDGAADPAVDDSAAWLEPDVALATAEAPELATAEALPEDEYAVAVTGGPPGLEADADALAAADDRASPVTTTVPVMFG